MKPAYIPDILRTPIGRYGGSLAKVRPDDLAALVIKSLLDRNPGVDPKEIEDVIFGAANQAGEDNRNVARMALLIAGKAFAAQSIACIRDLDLDPDIVNVNGGAIALGHPLGCSGTRISATLIHEMQKRPKVKYGLATMCIGVGQGAAVIYEKC